MYVVNAGLSANGTAGNITGFKIEDEDLTAITSSTRPLSDPNPNPAQIPFTPTSGLLPA